ncbi:MAG: SDR family NAD(P)-dependent oxidoreductase [Candidatus Phaeomarinobacter sp.]
MPGNSKQTGKWQDRYGPWALVTGASDGIGREMAVDLARRGLNLVLVARREAVLADLAASLSKQFSIETRVIAADLSDAAMVEHVLAATDDLDIGLLAAAAGYGLSGPALSSSRDGELNMIDVNCRAATAMTYALVPRLVARGQGGIVLMGSLVGFQGTPRAANYAATKAYIQTLAEGLRHELKPLGVDVISSAPGPVRSGFADRADMKMGMAQSPRSVARGTIRALGRKGTVRPGFLSRFLAASLATVPRAGRVRIMALIMGGMTSHQDDTHSTKTEKTA